MRIEMEQLKMFLIDSSILPKEQVEEAAREAKVVEMDLGTYLLEKKLVKEAELQRMYAYILGIPFVDLSKETVPIEILQVVPALIAKKYNIVSFQKTGSDLKVAMLNPEDLQTIDFIKKNKFEVPAKPVEKITEEIKEQTNETTESLWRRMH